jgi:hypothetical protein
MPRKSAKLRNSVEFKHAVPVVVRRPRFKVSSAIAEIDPVKLARKARIEIEVGTFAGNGCGSTVTAVVKKGRVVQLKVSPCAGDSPLRVDRALRSLVIAARKKLGLRGTPPKFHAMSFTAFQSRAADITVTTITCTQYCFWGHCFVCCTQPDGNVICGDRLILHKD